MKPEDPDLKEKKRVQPPKKNGRQQRRNSIIKLGGSSKTDGAMAKRDSPPLPVRSLRGLMPKERSKTVMPILNLLSRRKQRSKMVKPILNLLSKRRQRSTTPTISKSHLHNGKRLSGRGKISLAQIQVSACEALTLQIQSLDAQHGIAAEILQLARGTTVYI